MWSDDSLGCASDTDPMAERMNVPARRVFPRRLYEHARGMARNDEDGRIGHRLLPARRIKSPTGEPSVVEPSGKHTQS
jgi:hypothetical protein